MERIIALIVVFCLVFMLLSYAQSAEEGVMVYDLQVHNETEPLGIAADKAPSFSWKFTENRRNTLQQAYRITVGTTEGASDVYAGDWVLSNEQYGVVCDGLTVVPKTRYYWSVEVKDDQGNIGSAASVFETAVSDEAWEQAMWLGGNGIKRLRKEITLKGDVAKARAYVTGLGAYELYINGQKVGDRVLDPAFGNYYEIVRYATYDVGGLLQQGENALGILLGAGVYGSKFSKTYKGILLLDVEYTNGESETFVTDGSWKMTETSAYTADDAYKGEDYDARLEDGWLTCGYDDSAWQQAKQADTLLPVDNGVITTNSSDVTLAPQALGTNDYVIETEIQIVNVCGGLAFRAQDTSNFYMWQFTGDRLRAHIWKNGAVSVIEQAYGVSPYNAEERIPVKIQVEGSTITTTVNGTQLPPITDTANAAGTVGFRAAASSSEHAKFYSYTVKSLSGKVLCDAEAVAQWGAQARPAMQAQVDAIRVASSKPPVSVTQLEGSTYIVDAGINSTGWIKLQNLNGAAGTKVTIRYGELLKADGTVDPETMFHEYVSSYTLAGTGNESWSQKFSYTSFRYAEISGYEGLTADNILVEQVHSDVESTGRFESSNELLGQIQAAYINSQLSNLQSIPLDCPQREKTGWLGDAHITSEAVLYNLDAANIYSRWFHDWRSTMTDNGYMNLVCPDPNNGTGPNSGYRGGDVVWTAALMIIPWDLYQFTGDISVLADTYDIVKSHAQWQMANEPEPNIGPTMHWDWVGPDKDDITKQCVGTAYYYHVMDLAAKIAGVLGETTDAATFSEKAAAIRETFNTRYFNGAYYDTNTETANAIALAFGLVPDGQAETVLKSLENVIRVDKEGHMSVGVAGVRTLPKALTMYERPDLTYLMMTKETYPSLGFMIASGATSLWEYWEHPDWEGVGQGGTNARVFRSLNHCFLGGGFSTWLYQDLLGITAKEAGFDCIGIKPQIPLDLTYANGEMETVHGTVAVDWALDADRNLTMQVSVPTNTEAEISVPIRGAASDVTITEGADVWFAGGAGKTEAYTGQTDTHITFRVGSGDYAFTMTGQGAYPFEEVIESERPAAPEKPKKPSLYHVAATSDYVADFAGNVLDTSFWTWKNGSDAEYIQNGMFSKPAHDNWASFYSNKPYGANTAVSAEVMSSYPDAQHVAQFIGVRQAVSPVVAEAGNSGVWFGFTPNGEVRVGTNNLHLSCVTVPTGYDFTTAKQVQIVDRGDKISLFIEGENAVNVILGANSYEVQDQAGTSYGTVNEAVAEQGVIHFCAFGSVSTVDNISVGRAYVAEVYQNGVAVAKPGAGENEIRLTGDDTAVMICAVYGADGRLLSVKAGTGSKTVTLASNDCTVKLMVWSALETMEPQTQLITF